MGDFEIEKELQDKIDDKNIQFRRDIYGLLFRQLTSSITSDVASYFSRHFSTETLAERLTKNEYNNGVLTIEWEIYPYGINDKFNCQKYSLVLQHEFKRVYSNTAVAEAERNVENVKVKLITEKIDAINNAPITVHAENFIKNYVAVLQAEYMKRGYSFYQSTGIVHLNNTDDNYVYVSAPISIYKSAGNEEKPWLTVAVFNGCMQIIAPKHYLRYGDRVEYPSSQIFSNPNKTIRFVELNDKYNYEPNIGKELKDIIE